MHLGPKETPQTMPNTLWNIHTHLASFMKQCRFCSSKVKGTHLNTIERYFIYKEFSKNNHLNDEFNITPNKIFYALVKSR